MSAYRLLPSLFCGVRSNWRRQERPGAQRCAKRGLVIWPWKPSSPRSTTLPSSTIFPSNPDRQSSRLGCRRTGRYHACRPKPKTAVLYSRGTKPTYQASVIAVSYLRCQGIISQRKERGRLVSTSLPLPAVSLLTNSVYCPESLDVQDIC